MEVDFTRRWRDRRAVFLQKQVFFNPRRHEVERIPIKLAAHRIIKNHYLGSFPSANIRNRRNRQKPASISVFKEETNYERKTPNCLRSVVLFWAFLLFGSVSATGLSQTCGNGRIDPGEQCDNGGQSGGCCTAQCTFAAENSVCYDGNPITVNSCSAAGACRMPANDKLRRVPRFEQPAG
jgi:hypothetical protein